MKKLLYIIWAIVFLLGYFYVLQVQIISEVSNKISKVESSIESKYSSKIEEMNKQLDKLQNLLDDNNVNISELKKNSISISDKIIKKNNEILVKAIKSWDDKSCDKIEGKERQISCKNIFYYKTAIEKLDESLCDKIVNNSHNIEVCKIKVWVLKSRK